MNLSELLIIFVNKSAYHTTEDFNEIFKKILSNKKKKKNATKKLETFVEQSNLLIHIINAFSKINGQCSVKINQSKQS